MLHTALEETLCQLPGAPQWIRRHCIHRSAVSLHFNDIDRHLLISKLIHINMTVSGSGFNNRNRRIIYHTLDQSPAASWNQQIHIILHFINALVVSRSVLSIRLSALWNIHPAKCLLHGRNNRNVRMDGITSTLKIAQFPDLKHRPNASEVTFGRASKIMPTTPMATRTFQ